MSLQVLATVVLLPNGVMNILPWAGSAVGLGVLVDFPNVKDQKEVIVVVLKLRGFRE